MNEARHNFVPSVPFAWTDAIVIQLRELAAASHSARQMANQLGCSRNALISKCSRLGIALPHKRGYPRPGAGKSAKPKSNLANRLARFLPPNPDTVIDTSPLPPDPITAAPLHIDLADLTHFNCHWPYGDNSPFTFCGCASRENSPYCAPHSAMAFKVMTYGRRPV